VTTWAVVLVLLAASAYELALGLGWLSMGSQPGQEAKGQSAVTIAAFLALLIGMGSAVVSRGAHWWPQLLVPVAAASYMTAHYYAFDPYYLPSLRRFSTGIISPIWLYGVVVAAVVVALAIRRRPNVAPPLTPLVLFVCACTVFAEGLGH
jgi:hypothetical protein